jgi:hypothetical protein
MNPQVGPTYLFPHASFFGAVEEVVGGPLGGARARDPGASTINTGKHQRRPPYVVPELEIMEGPPPTLENINDRPPGRCCQKILAAATTYNKTSMTVPLGVLPISLAVATTVLEGDVDGRSP